MPIAPPALVSCISEFNTAAGNSFLELGPYPRASKPTQSTAPSTSGIPRICSICSVTETSCEASTVTHPNDRACWGRYLLESEEITTAAPRRWQDAAHARPTGPAPAINTVVPGPTPASIAPWYPVGKISVRQASSRIFSIACSLFGYVKSLKPAYGAITYSACPPIHPP